MTPVVSPSREWNWGEGSPPPPDQWWSEILTDGQLRMLIAINDRDDAYLADKRRAITCDRLRRYGLVKLVDGELRLTGWGQSAMTEFVEEGEYEIDCDGFVVFSPPSDSDGSPEGGDGEAGSVRSTTARAEGIAEPQSPSSSKDHP